MYRDRTLQTELWKISLFSLFIDHLGATATSRLWMTARCRRSDYASWRSMPMLPSTNIGKCTSRVAYPPSTCGTLIMALLVSIVSLKLVLNAVRKKPKNNYCFENYES
jgi:hypothetical protein